MQAFPMSIQEWSPQPNFEIHPKKRRWLQGAIHASEAETVEPPFSRVARSKRCGQNLTKAAGGSPKASGTKDKSPAGS